MPTGESSDKSPAKVSMCLSSLCFFLTQQCKTGPIGVGSLLAQRPVFTQASEIDQRIEYRDICASLRIESPLAGMDFDDLAQDQAIIPQFDLALVATLDIER